MAKVLCGYVHVKATPARQKKSKKGSSQAQEIRDYAKHWIIPHPLGNGGV
jgi:hypothetical protein